MTQRRAAALALALAAACGSERREAERTVRAYDDASVLAYRTRDFGPLQAVATRGEWGRVVVLVDLKTAARLVLESTLELLEVTDARRADPGTMAVRTRERWRYHDRPLDPGKAQGPELVAEMTLEYQLVRDGDRWKVDRVRTLSSEYLEPKGLELERPAHATPP